MANLQPRSISSLDYSRLFDEGCVKTRLNQLTQRFIAKFEHDDMLKIADKARRAFKPIPTYKHPIGKKREQMHKRARKEAEKVLELERKAFVKSRERGLFNRLTVIGTRLRMLMFALDETGKFVKGTFVSRVVHTGGHSYHQNYVTFFGTDQDAERMRSINQLKQVLRRDKYMLPYVSPEIKTLWDEIGEIITPDHYETWHNKQLVQVYGGRYTKEDEGLTTEAWRKAVKKRAEKIMASLSHHERKKVAEKQQKKEEEEKTEKEQKVVKITKEKARSPKVNNKRGTSKVVKNTKEKETS